MNRGRIFASLLATGLLATAPVWAGSAVKDIVDHEVPTLKDGSHIALYDVERAVLEACAHRKFEAAVTAPGLITARWVHGKHWFEVSIPYTDSTYSIRYKDSEYMKYDAARQRIDGDYNDYVSGLSEHIEAQLDVALNRLKSIKRNSKRLARFSPRSMA